MLELLGGITGSDQSQRTGILTATIYTEKRSRKQCIKHMNCSESLFTVHNFAVIE